LTVNRSIGFLETRINARVRRSSERRDSPESAVSAIRWAQLNHRRHAIVWAAWLTALKTFAVFYQQPSN